MIIKVMRLLVGMIVKRENNSMIQILIYLILHNLWKILGRFIGKVYD
jgi:hypothetical protein